LIFVFIKVKNGLCNPKKIFKMEQVKGMVKAMIPVALGVAAGMFLYEQLKKATAVASIDAVD